MLTAEQTSRLEQVTKIHAGAGNNGLVDACVMQAVDWVYRNKDHFTDTPECTPQTLRQFAIRLNDARWPTDDDRTEALKPLIPFLVGADPSPEAEQKRLYLFADFAVREAAPYWFDFLYKHPKKEKYRDWAKQMREVAPVVDASSADAARDVARKAACAADAADAACAANAAYAAYAADAAYAAYAADAANAAYAACAADAANAAYAAYAADAANAAYAAYAASNCLPIYRRAAEVLKQACEITA